MSFILKRMETRSGWGIVYMALVFALLAVGTALATFYFEQKTKDAEVIATSKNFTDWQGLSDTVTASSTQKIPLTDSITTDLWAGYDQLVAQGSFTAPERDQIFANIVKKNVQPQNIVPNITETDLTLSSSTPVDTYLELLAVILSQGSRVHEYELDVFARTVQNEIATGTPELARDADLYQRIAAAMLLMEVPPQLSSQHLEVVKSVGALSKAVSNMATWGGDPIEALVDVDSFHKAEAYVQNSVNDVLAAGALLVNKKS